MSQTEDAELFLHMARDRDPRAFSALYDRFAPSVFGLACRMLGRREEAEDALQEIFLALWERASSFDPARGGAAAWVAVVARSRCLDRLRRRAVRQGREQSIHTDAEEGDGLLPLPDPSPAALDVLQWRENRERVRKALEGLPGAQRSALEAAFYDGLTQEEIARKTGEPLGTVKTRTRLGLRKLAALLAERNL